jgi:hypothetical protein
VTTSPVHAKRKNLALYSFVSWVDVGLKPSIDNVNALACANPTGLTNPVLRFVVPRALNYVVERFVLEVFQAWEITDKELKRHGMRRLGTSNKDFQHLRKIRNKLVAHKIENSLKTTRYESWCKKTYGSHPAVLRLVERCALRVVAAIHRLKRRSLVTFEHYGLPSIPKVTESDIEALLAALKAKDIY